MNTKSFLSLLLISSAFLTSCKKELEPQDNSDAVATTTAAVTPTAQQQLQTTQQQQTPQTALNTVATSGTGMNPAHGQPGHRCDIAVGAPLSSAPTQNPGTATAMQTAPQSVSKTTTINPPQVAKPVAVAKGMNPSHGQPGHRCDIAVGAPLSTPVANKTPTTITQTPAPQTSTFQPTTIVGSNTAPGMNPAHGQPGHDCAVAVGAPLPAKSE